MVLIILFIYGMTLEGALDGIHFYITPNMTKLGEIKVWNEAANQIFYSLGPAFGGLITLASYNQFDNNCHRDAILVSFINCGTSVFAGFVVFAILGFMAKQNNQAVADVVSSGSGLAFIAYPEAVAKMGVTPVPQIMAFLFFLMLLTLGLDSMFTMVETLITCIMDHFRKLVPYKPLVVIGTCTVCFVFGWSMCTSGGIYMFDLINATCASWNMLLFAFLEVVLVAWGYGVNNFLNNIEEMGMKLPRPIKWYWKACWCFITPVILLVLVVVTFAKHDLLKTGNYVWPDGIQALGILLPLSSAILIPLTLIYQIWRRSRLGKPLGMAMLRRTDNWKSAIAAEPSVPEEVDGIPRSRKGSRISFRQHLPRNSEILL